MMRVLLHLASEETRSEGLYHFDGYSLFSVCLEFLFSLLPLRIAALCPPFLGISFSPTSPFRLGSARMDIIYSVPLPLSPPPLSPLFPLPALPTTDMIPEYPTWIPFWCSTPRAFLFSPTPLLLDQFLCNTKVRTYAKLSFPSRPSTPWPWDRVDNFLELLCFGYLVLKPSSTALRLFRPCWVSFTCPHCHRESSFHYHFSPFL